MSRIAVDVLRIPFYSSRYPEGRMFRESLIYAVNIRPLTHIQEIGGHAMFRFPWSKWGPLGIIALVVILVACTGPEGVAGPKGGLGPQGPPGPEGFA